MANIDYDLPDKEPARIGNQAKVFREPEREMVARAVCSHCSHDTYVHEGDELTCPACLTHGVGFVMTVVQAARPVSAFTSVQLTALRAKQARHDKLRFMAAERVRPKGKSHLSRSEMDAMAQNVYGEAQGMKAAGQNRPQGLVATQMWMDEGMGLGTGLQNAQNPFADNYQAGNNIAAATPWTSERVIGTKTQELAVTHELMDALEYLLKDIEDNIRLNPKLEAIGRNYAMRRAKAALGHGRAML